MFIKCWLVCPTEWEGGERESAGEPLERQLALDGVIRVVVGCQVSM